MYTNIAIHYRKNIPNYVLQIVINMYKNNSVFIKLWHDRTHCQSVNEGV